MRITERASLSKDLTRRDFLKVAGTGVAGAALLGGTGCASITEGVSRLPKNYLPNGGSRMNVVLIVIDSLRTDHVGAYGDSRAQTPNLDAFAKESLKFTRAYPEAAPTIPARRAIHTGARSSPFDDCPPLPEDQQTLSQRHS